MATMYDKLGDLLNETLSSGKIKFVHIDKEEKPSLAEEKINKTKSSNSNEASSSTEQNKHTNRKSTQIKQKTKKVYKTITPEIERSYRLLDITISANAEDIKRAYKEKLKYYHPDKHPNNPILQKVSADKTRQVIEAYRLILKFKYE